MTTLNEIQEYLKSLDITNDRIKRCYDMIPDDAIKADNLEELWNACSEEDDSAYKAIKTTLKTHNFNISNEYIKYANDKTCKQFGNLETKEKHRLLFYVLMLDKLL